MLTGQAGVRRWAQKGEVEAGRGGNLVVSGSEGELRKALRHG